MPVIKPISSASAQRGGLRDSLKKPFSSISVHFNPA
jgi:hypothetical protein